MKPSISVQEFKKAILQEIMSSITAQRRIRQNKTGNEKNSKPIGRWHITKMEMWDKDYIDMEVKAYIEITSAGDGEFQFGIVSGSMHGDFIRCADELVFDFTWDGCDENDETSGDGWFKSIDGKNGEGEIRFHGGDKSLFWAKIVKKPRGRGK